MYNIINTSKTGMQANQSKIDVISNNMVNVQTSGYKKLDMGFIDLYTETLDRISYPNSNKGALTGTGVKESIATRNFAQGSLKNTGIKTNLGIDGDGFFCVTKPDGTQSYTRNGEFNLDANGKLVDDYGNAVEITFNEGRNYENVDLSNGELSINKSGEVFLNNENIGKIDIYAPQGEDTFISVGDGLFIPREGTNVMVVQNPTIRQGYTEMSNVNMQNEMTDLIMVQRAFQFNSKAMQATDEMIGMINNLQGR
ncbi:flagellar hook-basal body complex protein [Romboutsia sp.]|uniref:flagellar hook-basal body complex protein n=1 Tax=Romboutsia sp. TaxID=1965302 RepID=UPI003F401DC7